MTKKRVVCIIVAALLFTVACGKKNEPLGNIYRTIERSEQSEELAGFSDFFTAIESPRSVDSIVVFA